MKITGEQVINNSRQAIAGVMKHFANTPTLALNGTPTTPTDVTATLQGAIDAAAAAEKAFHDAVAAKRAAIAKSNAHLGALKALVKNQLGSSQGALGDFGFTSPSRQVPDEATKAAAVAKRAATRAARHTMGKRQEGADQGCGHDDVPLGTIRPQGIETRVGRPPGDVSGGLLFCVVFPVRAGMLEPSGSRSGRRRHGVALAASALTRSGSPLKMRAD